VSPKPALDAILDALPGGTTLPVIIDAVNQQCAIPAKAEPEWRLANQDRTYPLREIIASLARTGFRLKRQRDEKGNKDEYVYVRLNDA
jgi:hypothetical protein